MSDPIIGVQNTRVFFAPNHLGPLFLAHIQRQFWLRAMESSSLPGKEIVALYSVAGVKPSSPAMSALVFMTLSFLVSITRFSGDCLNNLL